MAGRLVTSCMVAWTAFMYSSCRLEGRRFDTSSIVAWLWRLIGGAAEAYGGLWLVPALAVAPSADALIPAV
jgi:hypothetical protein